ncbi:MAG: hypothetical protein KatS3mg090_0452 [Patescibacteria group bacterium]|nr:MAG: hypothetical protein KatS3mg090_0452 [Patescibacteria group bacterium]
MRDQKILEDIIQNFSLEKFRRFFDYKSYDFKPYSDDISYFIKDFSRFDTAEKIGEIVSGNLEIVFAGVKTKGDITERSSKKAQYDLAKSILKTIDGGRFLAGIFIFYDEAGNFRLSLVYQLPKGKKRQWSVFKRHTYYVSKGRPYRTFLKALVELRFDSLDSIIGAFSVAPLTKEFYTEIQDWYAWALKHSWFPGGKIEENLIRLLTRLIFVWFLKERGLIAPKIFEEEFLQNTIEDFGRKDYFYNVILQNLFFATLNRRYEKRRFASDGEFYERRKDYNVNNVYRYQDQLLIPKEDFIRLFQNTPFINGGLFECLDDKDKRVIIDGFSREEKWRAKLPDYLFFSQEKKEDLSHFYGSRKEKKVRGLINILKDYNFTADESSPIDIEVSLDPELLGHIFENLLAAYNPETQTTARKATGSYYTPKEIVEFMVDEALFYYLKSKTSLEEEKIRQLLSYEEKEVELTDDQRVKIVEAIDTLKIIDPAVGSGAFPMSILQKLVHILGKVDPDNTLWRERQYNRALEEVEKILKIQDKEKREQRLKEVNENFDDSINYPDYARKLYLIENSIYGVDIQPIAIQICKLRFFLTLLIDQKIHPKKENFGVKPLPHLETKFVSANTLIKLKGSQKIDQLDWVRKGDHILQPLKEELKELYKKHFHIKNRAEKKRLQEKAKTIRKKIKDLLIKEGWQSEEAKKIAEFDIFSQTATADWFEPEWMFGVEDGFDIVIVNPPYISTKGIKNTYKKILKDQYGFVDDLYNHFYFKGFQLLKEKEILTYISSKTFWTIQTKQNLRDLLLKNRILKIVDTANPFLSVMVDTGIIVAQKEINPDENYVISFLDFNRQREYKVNVKVYKKVVNNVFFEPNRLNIKIYKKFGEKVKDLMDKWWDKISTSKNIKKHENQLKKYRETLKEGDITLLGLITEGGQGLATGDNGKYVGVLEKTKYAEKIIEERPRKLCLFIENHKPKELTFLKTKEEVKRYINSLTEEEIRKLFDDLKKKYGRDIFGQGWLYRIVRKWEVADVNKLTKEEKLDGISGNQTFVPYDKGDKEGNRWYAPTPYYIDWSKKNVKFLKENSGRKGIGMPVVRNPQFYFRKGFCWTDVNSTYLKARIKEKGVYDVLTMSLFSQTYLPDWFFVCMINSKFISEYVDSFINSTSHFQINDARQLPIIIPTKNQLKEFEDIFNKAYTVKKNKFEGKITPKEAERKLEEIQKELDKKVLELYGLVNS